MALGEESSELLDVTRQSYADSAARYALWSDSYESFPGLRAALAQFEKRLLQGSPVLDAGCGCGRDSRELAAAGTAVLALDFEPKMLTEWTSLGEGQLQRVVADLRQPPVRPRSLGGVWACASLVHQTESSLRGALEVLLDLLAPGGVFAASMRSKGPAGGLRVWDPVSGPRSRILFPAQECVALLEELGLRDVGSQPSGDGWYTAWGVTA